MIHVTSVIVMVRIGECTWSVAPDGQPLPTEADAPIRFKEKSLEEQADDDVKAGRVYRWPYTMFRFWDTPEEDEAWDYLQEGPPDEPR